MIDLNKKVKNTIDKALLILTKLQKPDGSWRFCFEGPPLTDAYMILLLRLFDSREEGLVRSLANRLISKQEKNGSWKLFQDQDGGDLSATIDAYYALTLAGYFNETTPQAKKAEEFILSRGGISKAGSFTKLVLAMTGQISWNNLPDIPIEIILLPSWFPVSFFDLVGYTRVHAVPIMICADKQFTVVLPGKPDLSHLLIKRTAAPGAKPQLPKVLEEQLEQLRKESKVKPMALHQVALRKAEKYMQEHIEPDGTLYSYFSSTFLMIFALLALGYEKNNPLIKNAMDGLNTLLFPVGSYIHEQETTSTVWDTALIAATINGAGFTCDQPVLRKAIKYLVERQHHKKGDWAVHNPDAEPGGWGFSDVNTMNPDVDDTTAALRALHPFIRKEPKRYKGAWDRGMIWIFSMQNQDGGWPAFEKNTYKKWPLLLPLNEKNILTDPSTADLTGRTLEFLGNYAGFTLKDVRVRKAVEWLFKDQQEDGSWFGRWGIAYIYGTWAALTGLLAVGIQPGCPVIQKGVKWLLTIQNPNGGWGESCLSDVWKKYVPLGMSTPSQTAWALNALVAASYKPTPEIRKGVKYLVSMFEKNTWQDDYPTGSGLAGGFYIDYQSYGYIWPLLALSHYYSKFSG